MSIIKRILLNLCLRLLDDVTLTDTRTMKQKNIHTWCRLSYGDSGWRDYYAHETMRLLKELGMGRNREDYNRLVGQRLQLMKINSDIHNWGKKQES